MKKLMLAVAIVCAAVMAQAAQFNWSASGVAGYNTTDKYTGSAVIHVLQGGSEVYSQTGSMKDGSIAATLVQSELIVGGKQTQCYYTMTDSAGNTFTSNTRTFGAQATSTPAIAFAANGSWTAAPEPTSALLLLLGVAGLTLKRKQA